MSPERWSALMDAFGIEPHRGTYERLATAYAESHRHYHTQDHIRSCLAELDAAPGLATSNAEVEIALWFHDAIYLPRSSDNEARSADWAAQFMASAGLPTVSCARVREHIMATRHEAQPPAGDSALVVDVDLSILGQDPATYDAFEKNVREEYRWVPGFLYRRKRREILASFLERDAIYVMALFRDRYEAAARRNLRQAIAVLQ